jgi:hypothetical protein
MKLGLVLRGIWLGCLLVAIFSSQQLAALSLANPTARIPRDQPDQIDLRFEMIAIEAEDLQEAGQTDFSNQSITNMIVQKLDICLASNQVNCGANGVDKIEYAGKREQDNTDINDFDLINYISFPDNFLELTPDPDVDQRYDANVRLRIKKQSDADDPNYAVGQVLTLSYEDNSEDVTATTALSSIVTTQPQSLSVKPVNQGLVVSWEPQQSVDFANSTSGPPNGMRVYLFPVGTGDAISLVQVIKSYDDDIDQEQLSAGCDLRPDTSNSTCEFECYHNQTGYLSATQVQSVQPNVLIKETASPDTRAVQFEELDLDSYYAAVLQYLPEGAQDSSDVSNCALGQPIQTFSYAQITSGSTPKIKDPRCFIATAAYGSAWHQHLNELRWFRDHLLLTNSLGRAMVDWYYAASPPAAAWIAEHPAIAQLVRGLLLVPVYTIKACRARPGATLGMAGISLLSLLIFVSWRRRSAF